MIRIEKYEAARPMTVYKVGSIRKKQPQKCPHFYKRKKSLKMISYVSFLISTYAIITMSGNIRQLSTKVNYEECSPPSNIGNIKVRITRPLDLHIMILLISSYNL